MEVERGRGREAERQRGGVRDGAGETRRAQQPNGRMGRHGTVRYGTVRYVSVCYGARNPPRPSNLASTLDYTSTTHTSNDVIRRVQHDGVRRVKPRKGLLEQLGVAACEATDETTAGAHWRSS